jgi:hypothetical protein
MWGEGAGKALVTAAIRRLLDLRHVLGEDSSEISEIKSETALE